MKYRLYVDEVGNSDLGASLNPNHRYLSLTGVIIELEYVQKYVFPVIENLKQKYFDSHPDEPVILHRKELVNKKYPFDKLLNPLIEKSFNADLLQILTELNFVVITVVIDKLEFKNQYQVWRFDPYHYCLSVLVERFVNWLKSVNSVGDVMAESRGGKEDRRLKESFKRLYDHGTDYVEPNDFSKYLTSQELKVKPKSNNIAGLQIADLIAYPSYKSMIAIHEQQELADNFGKRIVKILEESKLRRSVDGKIDGWGRKWLP